MPRPEEMHNKTETLAMRPRSSTLNSVRSAAGTVVNTTRRATESVGHTVLDVLNADPPLGAWAATAQASSTAPTLQDIRRGARESQDWTDEERERGWKRSNTGRRSLGARSSRLGQDVGTQREPQLTEPFPVLEEIEIPKTEAIEKAEDAEKRVDQISITASSPKAEHGTRSRVRSSGWVPPPRLPWTASAWIGFKAFLRWNTRPFGFLITLYCLNVVAWGGMLFLLLCNAGPAMCNTSDGKGGTFYDCNDLYSPRRVWIEIDSQILNGLFCVTGFGLIPWRFRDLYYLLRWRLTSGRLVGLERKLYGLRKLGGINKTWLRLPGSDTLDQLSAETYLQSRRGDHVRDVEHGPSSIDDVRLPIPLAKAPPNPLTGIRAPPTALWKLDFFIWCQIANTALQAVLCGFMWGYSRFTRPSWATGLFIALACIVAGVGGIVSYIEGRRVKRVEGYQPSPAVQQELLKRQQSEGG